MTTNKSLRTIKFLLPAMVLAGTIAIAFSFTSLKNPVQEQAAKAKPLAMETLYFRYTPPTVNDYSPASVATQSNWNNIDEEEACELEANERACSFSIEIPEEKESDYLASGKPTTKLIIETGVLTDAYVTNLKDSLTNDPLTKSIENILQP